MKNVRNTNAFGQGGKISASLRQASAFLKGSSQVIAVKAVREVKKYGKEMEKDFVKKAQIARNENVRDALHAVVDGGLELTALALEGMSIFGSIVAGVSDAYKEEAEELVKNVVSDVSKRLNEAADLTGMIAKDDILKAKLKKLEGTASSKTAEESFLKLMKGISVLKKALK